MSLTVSSFKDNWKHLREVFSIVLSTQTLTTSGIYNIHLTAHMVNVNNGAFNFVYSACLLTHFEWTITSNSWSVVTLFTSKINRNSGQEMVTFQRWNNNNIFGILQVLSIPLNSPI